MRRLTAVILATSFAAAAPAAHAQTLTGQLARPSAADGLVLFSQAASDGRWYLHLRGRNGKVVRLPVAGAAQPFEADLGTTAAGRVVAVYARCVGTACRLVQLELATNRERVLAQTHAAGQSERAPTIFDGVVGFHRTSARRPGGGTYRLMALRRGARSRAVKRLRSRQVVVGADLGARGLAIATARDTADERHEVSVQVKPAGRPFRTLQETSSGAMSFARVTTPSWRGNDLYWGFARLLDVPSRMLLRARLTRSGTTFTATTAPSALRDGGTIAGVAADALRSASPLWLLNEADEDPDPEVRTALSAHRLRDLRFGPAPRGLGLARR